MVGLVGWSFGGASEWRGKKGFRGTKSPGPRSLTLFPLLPLEGPRNFQIGRSHPDPLQRACPLGKLQMNNIRLPSKMEGAGVDDWPGIAAQSGDGPV